MQVTSGRPESNLETENQLRHLVSDGVTLILSLLKSLCPVSMCCAVCLQEGTGDRKMFFFHPVLYIHRKNSSWSNFREIGNQQILELYLKINDFLRCCFKKNYPKLYNFLLLSDLGVQNSIINFFQGLNKDILLYLRNCTKVYPMMHFL